MCVPLPPPRSFDANVASDKLARRAILAAGRGLSVDRRGGGSGNTRKNVLDFCFWGLGWTASRSCGRLSPRTRAAFISCLLRNAISDGALHFYRWWIAAGPGLAILTIVLGFNFLGDGLRDLLDPRSA